MTTKQQTTIDVVGMTCGACIRHVDHALRELDGVEGVDVQLRKGIVRGQHYPESAPVQSLITAIEGAGYEAREAGAP